MWHKQQQSKGEKMDKLKMIIKFENLPVDKRR